MDTKRHKDAAALAAIKEVQSATEAAMQAVVEYIRNESRPTSEHAHAIIDDVLATHDCESPEGHIVAGGTQSSEPHEIGSGVITSGEPIVIDIYPHSKKTGYFADMTRTVCKGEPSAELQKMYDTVLAAQELALQMVKSGVSCRDLQAVVMEHFVTAGYETSGKGTEFPYAEGYVHSLGHGVGLQIHEAPYLSLKSDEVLAEGDVITIEPGLYYKHLGGIRIEDLLVVTETGAENLTTFPKYLQLP